MQVVASGSGGSNKILKGLVGDHPSEKPYTATKAPKGFDIMLADAISQFSLTKEQIETLGFMTVRREIASAQLGSRVYYRRATIERLFGNGK